MDDHDTELSRNSRPDEEIGTAARPKKQYTTVVVEREIDTPRSVAFDAACELIDEATGGRVSDGAGDPRGLGARFEFILGGMALSEEVISFEPPWRRVYELSGAPVALYQGTTAFTDQGDTCLMAWSVLVEPLPGGGSDEFLAMVRPFLDGFADRVKNRSEATWAVRVK